MTELTGRCSIARKSFLARTIPQFLSTGGLRLLRFELAFTKIRPGSDWRRGGPPSSNVAVLR